MPTRVMCLIDNIGKLIKDFETVSADLELSGERAVGTSTNLVASDFFKHMRTVPRLNSTVPYYLFVYGKITNVTNLQSCPRKLRSRFGTVDCLKKSPAVATMFSAPVNCTIANVVCYPNKTRWRFMTLYVTRT